MRVPGADVTAYLGFAATLAGGLHGLAGSSSRRRWSKAMPSVGGLQPLPQTLAEAVERFESSAIARDYFGDGFVDHYSAMRRWEVAKYDRAVTDWERRRYFEMV